MNLITHPSRPMVPSPPWPVPLDGIPIVYEDDEEEELDMGDANYHFWAMQLSFNVVSAFLQEECPDLQAFANMNCYYFEGGPRNPKSGNLPYISADLMIVRPYERLPFDLVSYTIGRQGPAPLTVFEVLSKRSTQQRDLGDKLIIYGKLGIREYVLVDLTGNFLPEILLLKTLQPDGTWKDQGDADGGVTSELGLRIIRGNGPEVAFVSAKTGKRFVMPHEAEDEAKARHEAEEAREQAEEAREQAEKARQQAEKAKKRAQEAKQQAQERAHAEAEARRQADERAMAEAEARRQAEERIRVLEEEIKRLRDNQK